ncbi:MAG: NYN domain-containing protein [Devosia sp.]
MIDADNISADLAPAVFQRIAVLGTPVVRRLYGNPISVAGWDSAARDEVYEHRPQVSVTSAKNGADIALAVGAMDILHAGWVDAFCIVSNDRDFVPLAVRLRASRVLVHSICTKADDRLLKVFDTLFEATPKAISPPVKPSKPVKLINPVVAAFLKIASADKREFSLTEAGKLLREVAPPHIIPPPGKGKLRKTLEKTEQFVFTGTGTSTRVRLKP